MKRNLVTTGIALAVMHAQSAWAADGAAPSWAWIGHEEVIGSLSDGLGGGLTLGRDGLLIEWAPTLQALGWRRVEGATSLAPSTESVALVATTDGLLAVTGGLVLGEAVEPGPQSCSYAPALAEHALLRAPSRPFAVATDSTSLYLIDTFGWCRLGLDLRADPVCHGRVGRISEGVVASSSPALLTCEDTDSGARWSLIGLADADERAAMTTGGACPAAGMTFDDWVAAADGDTIVVARESGLETTSSPGARAATAPLGFSGVGLVLVERFDATCAGPRRTLVSMPGSAPIWRGECGGSEALIPWRSASGEGLGVALAVPSTDGVELLTFDLGATLRWRDSVDALPSERATVVGRDGLEAVDDPLAISERAGTPVVVARSAAGTVEQVDTVIRITRGTRSAMIEVRGSSAVVAGVEGLWASPSARGRVAQLGGDGLAEMPTIRAPGELVSALRALVRR